MDWIKLPFALDHPAGMSDLQFLTVRIAGLILCYFLFKKYLWPPHGQVHLDSRRTSIAEARDQVEIALVQSRESLAEYTRRLDGFADEARQRNEEAVREAAALHDTIISEAEQQARLLRRRAEEEANRQRAKALLDLRTQFVDEAISAARTAAKSGMNAARDRDLVGAFTRSLGQDA